MPDLKRSLIQVTQVARFAASAIWGGVFKVGFAIWTLLGAWKLLGDYAFEKWPMPAWINSRSIDDWTIALLLILLLSLAEGAYSAAQRSHLSTTLEEPHVLFDRIDLEQTGTKKGLVLKNSGTAVARSIRVNPIESYAFTQLQVLESGDEGVVKIVRIDSWHEFQYMISTFKKKGALIRKPLVATYRDVSGSQYHTKAELVITGKEDCYIENCEVQKISNRT